MAISLGSGTQLSVAQPPYEEYTMLPEAEQERRRKIVWKESTPPPPLPYKLTPAPSIESTQKRDVQEKVVHDKCGMDKEDAEKHCLDVIAQVNIVEIDLKRAIKEGSELWSNIGGISGHNQAGAL
ncbi:hypothetical protein HAX54_023655, partial [Datura stramonium]|nr:hypothetical protein [Datura stramonium]